MRVGERFARRFTSNCFSILSFPLQVNTMIIIDVHARDIVDRFVRDSVMDPREFEWGRACLTH